METFNGNTVLEYPCTGSDARVFLFKKYMYVCGVKAFAFALKGMPRDSNPRGFFMPKKIFEKYFANRLFVSIKILYLYIIESHKSKRNHDNRKYHKDNK